MTMLSIILPEPIAKASQAVAKELGVSRTQFIRQAIAHELENYYSEREQKAMAKSMTAMKKSKKYLKEINEIMGGMDSNLPDEGDAWWTGKKS